MKRYFYLFILFLGLFQFTTSAQSQVFFEDFDTPAPFSTAFGTAPQCAPTPSTAGSYCMVTSANGKSQGWPTNFTDHTNPGTGRFMAIDGSTSNTNSSVVWAKSIPVAAGTHSFIFWTRVVTGAHSLDLDVRVNGVVVATITVDQTVWTQHPVTVTLPTSGYNTFAIEQTSVGNASGFRDFGIDDISLETCCERPVPYFNINGSPASTVYVNPGNPVTMNITLDTNATNYLVSVTNSNGDQHMKWFTYAQLVVATSGGNFNLLNFCNNPAMAGLGASPNSSPSMPLIEGQCYTVTLVAQNIRCGFNWEVFSRTLCINCTEKPIPYFTLNGSTANPLNMPFASPLAITMNINFDPNADHYLVSVTDNSNGDEHMKWFTAAQLAATSPGGNFNLVNFCNSPAMNNLSASPTSSPNMPLVAGHCYTVLLVAQNRPCYVWETMTRELCLVCERPTPKFTMNGSNASPLEIAIGGPLQLNITLDPNATNYLLAVRNANGDEHMKWFTAAAMPSTIDLIAFCASPAMAGLGQGMGSSPEMPLHKGSCYEVSLVAQNVPCGFNWEILTKIFCISCCEPDGVFDEYDGQEKGFEEWEYKSGAISNATSESGHFTVYPNPAGDRATIAFSTPADGAIVNLAIYDLSGKQLTELIRDEYTASGEHTVALDVSTLTNGMYYCKLTLNGMTSTTKFVVRN